MRCPYCHVHYDDSERVCPVCGRRAGMTASPKRSAASWESHSTAPKKSASGHKTAASSNGWKTTTKSSGAGRTATGTPRPDHPYQEPAAKRTATGTLRTYQAAADGWQKQSSGGGNLAPKLILGIVTAVFALQLIGPLLFYNVIGSDPISSVSEDISSVIFGSDDVFYEEQELPEWLEGTWSCADTGSTLTIAADGSVEYDAGDSAVLVCDSSDFYQITWDEATEEDLSSYLPDALIQLDSDGYLFYELDADVFVWLDSFSYNVFCFAVPKDAEIITEFFAESPDTGEQIIFQKQTQTT
ncbi:MAG: hypothetical protein ACI3XY_02310 [Butyricicoccaceae bacterium]